MNNDFIVPGIKESILEAKLNNALVEQKKCIKNTNNYFILWINTQFYKTNSTICMVSAVSCLRLFHFYLFIYLNFFLKLTLILFSTGRVFNLAL